MNIGFDSVIGILASILTTSSFLPQIIKAYKTKKMDDVSQYLMILFSSGAILWIVYGFMQDDIVIIGANTVAATFNIILFFFSFIYMSRWKSNQLLDVLQLPSIDLLIIKITTLIFFYTCILEMWILWILILIKIANLKIANALYITNTNLVNLRLIKVKSRSFAYFKLL